MFIIYRLFLIAFTLFSSVSAMEYNAKQIWIDEILTLADQEEDINQKYNIENKLNSLWDLDQLEILQNAAVQLKIDWLIKSINRRIENIYLAQFHCSDLKDIANHIAKCLMQDKNTFKCRIAELASSLMSFSLKHIVARIIGENIIYRNSSAELFLYNKEMNSHPRISPFIGYAHDVFISNVQKKLAFITPGRGYFGVVDLTSGEQIKYTYDSLCSAMAWCNNNSDLMIAFGNKLYTLVNENLIYIMDLPFENDHFHMTLNKNDLRLFLVSDVSGSYIIDLATKKLTKLNTDALSQCFFLTQDVQWIDNDAAILINISVGRIDEEPMSVIIDSNTGAVLKSFKHKYKSVISNDGSHLAFLDTDNHFKIIKINGWKCIGDIHMSGDGFEFGLNKDGTQFMVAPQYEGIQSNHEMIMYDLSLLTDTKRRLENMTYPQAMMLYEIHKTCNQSKSFNWTDEERKIHESFGNDDAGKAIQAAIDQFVNVTFKENINV